MHLHCPECTAEISAEGINLVKTIAVCKECNNLFEFSAELDRARHPAPIRREYSIPNGIEVLSLSNHLEITINWRKSAKYFTPFFALFWNGFISIFIFLGIASGEMIMAIFMIPFILVGIYLIYASLGYMLNTTYITVNERSFWVEHKPINFLIQKDQYYEIDEIDQLYVRRHEVGKSNDTPVHAYAVDLMLKNGETIKLVKELHAVQYARYIEQEIEYFLKIPDRPVEGEWGR